VNGSDPEREQRRLRVVRFAGHPRRRMVLASRAMLKKL